MAATGWKAEPGMMPTSARRTDRFRNHRQAGFSLLEILVCLLLLGILSVGFARIFQGSLAIGQIQGAETTRLQERREAVRHQFAEMEGADRVIAIPPEQPVTP